jgi:hypothetical protein
MRTKKQAMLAREVMRAAAAVPDEMVELVGLLTDVRRARLDLLRQPGMLAELKRTIKLMDKREANVVRKMLADDLRLMRQIDRQAICVARGAEGTA